MAEFTLTGTEELVDELLIQANSVEEAETIARNYASNWELDLYNLQAATERQIRMHRLRLLPEPPTPLAESLTLIDSQNS
ncbi:MAG: hypothetical protein VKK04_04645 [Synechococcales bacterium]|nr:hypothetical protein [Synechococcales bacterium]